MLSFYQRFLILLCAVVSSSTVHAQYERSITQPLDPFSVNSDELGALSNSANLFTGEVQFPVSLMSVPGANGMSLSINASYNSNVQYQVKTWNLEAPTSTLGLGWAMSSAAIVVDKKNTGTIIDDVHYLMSEAGSSELVWVSASSSLRHYKSIKNPNILVSYDQSLETWEVIDENGIKSIYGDKNSSRSTIDWGVKWGNWIGESVVTTGQEQYPVKWKLSEIKNPWGAGLKYSYLNIERAVGSGGKLHTEASYLSRIEDHIGNYISLNYTDKTAEEFIQPHTEASEPDAYQEIYETKYLSYVEGYNSFDLKLQRVDFTYGFLGTGNLKKRLLTKITRTSSSGNVSAASEFEYYTTGNRIGSIKSFKSPSGVTVDYTYSTSTVNVISNRDTQIYAPSGFAEPGVWQGPDYSVVTWRKRPNGVYSDQAQPLAVQVYTRNGQWEKFEEIISSVEVWEGYQLYRITMQKDFFAIMTNRNDGSGNNDLFIFHKDPNKPGNWIKTQYLNQDFGNWEFNIGSELISGNGYVGVVNRPEGYMSLFTKRGNSWEQELKGTPGISENYNYTNSGNWIIRHWTWGSDRVDLFYLNEEKNWVMKTFNSSDVPFDTDPINPNGGDYTNWHAGDGMAVVMADDGDEYIYRWDENYNPVISHQIPATDDNSSVAIVANSFVGVQGIDGNQDYRFYTYRFNGNNWIVKNGMYNTGTNRKPAYSHNLMTYMSVLESGAFFQFNPNISDYSTGLIDGNKYTYTKIGQGNFFAFDNKIFRLSESGSLDYKFTAAVTSINEPQFGYGQESFLAFEDGSPTANKSKIYFMKNGEYSGSHDVLNNEFINYHESGNAKFFGKQNYVGNNAFIASPVLNSFNATWLWLHKVYDGKSRYNTQHFPISKITVTSAEQIDVTNFVYQSMTGLFDENTHTARHSSVKVIKGNDIVNPDNGYTKTYFFKGSDSGEAFPQNGTEVIDNLKHLTGQTYKTEVYNSDDVLISKSETYYNVFTSDIKNSLNKTVAVSYQPRVVKSVTINDGISQTSEVAYNSRHLPYYTTTYNIDGNGNTDTYKSFNKYWYEAYDASSNNLLAPVIQVRNTVNSATISSNVTTWTTWNGIYAPKATYVWNGKGSSTFSAWTGTPDSYSWLKTSEINKRDGFGNAIQSMDAEGIQSATIMGHNNSLPLMSVQNATHTEIFADDFDDESIMNGDPVAWHKVGTSWSIEENGALRWSHTGANGRLTTSELNIAKNFTMEFDARFENVNATGFVGVQYNKNAQADAPSVSGYLFKINYANSPSLEFVAKSATAGNFITETGSDAVAYEWNRFRITRIGDDVKIYCNGKLITSYTDNAFSGNYFSIMIQNVDAQVDNFRIYPADAYASSTSFDKNFKYPELSIGETFNHGKTLYNLENEAVAIIDDNGNPVSTSAGYSSVLYNDDYVVSDPNISHATSIHGSGFYEDFSHKNYPDWIFTTNSNVTTWSRTNGQLQILSAGNASGFPDWCKLTKTVEGNRVGVELDVTLDPNADKINFGIGIGSNNKYNSAAWLNFYGKSVVKIFSGDSYTNLSAEFKNGLTYRIKIVLDFTSQTADYYLDGKLIAANKPFNAPISSFTEVVIENQGLGIAGTWIVDNLVVYGDHVSSSTFSDASGRVLQSMTEQDETHIMVAQSLYDAYGRAAVSVKPTRIIGDLVYRPGYASFNFSTNTLSGEVVTLNPDDAGYPYSQTVYDNSPLSRIIESSTPGVDHMLGGGHTTKYFYGNNTTIPVGKSYTANSYSVAKTIDPQGVVSLGMTDKMGNTIRSVSDFGGLNITTEYEYDDKGNTTTTYPPNYFAPPAGSTADSYKTTNTYDEQSRLISSTNPDGGISSYVYDKFGRVRFMQDANGVVGGYFSYWEYDNLGRITEEGIAQGKWNADDLEDMLNDFADWQPLLNFNFSERSSGGDPEAKTYEPRPIGGGTEWIASYEAKEFEATGALGVIDHVTLTAGHEIRLLPGFSASSGDGTITPQYEYVFKATAVNPISGGKEWKKRYTYGNHHNNMYNNGALVAVEVNNDDNDDVDVKESFEYLQFGQVSTHSTEIVELNEAPEVITYEYDPLTGANLGYSTNYNAVAYEYDAMGRTRRIKDADTNVTFAEYTYEQLSGGLSSESINDGMITTNYSYNSMGWLTEIDHVNYWKESIFYEGGASGSAYYNGLIAKTITDYSFNSGTAMIPGTLESITNWYLYDKIGRLKKANSSLGGTTHDYGVTTQASYDGNGNLLSVGLEDGQGLRELTYVANTNRLDQLRDSKTFMRYFYDANGNVIQTKNEGIYGSASENDGYYEIKYDKHLNKVNHIWGYKGLGISKYGFDGAGERVYAIQYNRDDFNDILETTQYIRGGKDYPLFEKVTDAEGEVKVTTYVYGNGGLIAFNTGVTEPEVTTYSLTLESDVESEEREAFGAGYDQGYKVNNSTLYDHSDVGASQTSVRLSGALGEIVAMAKSIEVSAGDEVDMEVFVKYTDPVASNDPASSVTTGIATNFTGAFGLTPTENGPVYSFFNELFSAGSIIDNIDDTDDIPDAYLNYLLFDKNYVLQDFGHQPITSFALEDGSCGGTEGCMHEKLHFDDLVMSHSGYLYVYVSNETDKLSDVYFDDLKITHTANPSWNYVLKDHLGSNRVTVNGQGNVEAYTDYLPLGGVMRSSESQLTKYQYTGQEYQGFSVHNYRARLYDDRSGRFYAMDPMGQFANPYNGMGNNPVNAIDPDGEWVHIAIGAVVGAVVGGVSAGIAGENVWAGIGIGAAVGALSAATAGAGTAAVTGGTFASGGATMASGAAANVGFGAMMAGGIASGAVSGGVNSAIHGGNVGTGIWQGALGGAIGGLVPSINVSGILPGMAVGAAGGALGGGLAGGTLSVINGRDFGDGFEQGAYNGAIGGAMSGGISGGIKAYNEYRGVLFGGRNNKTMTESRYLNRNFGKAYKELQDKIEEINNSKPGTEDYDKRMSLILNRLGDAKNLVGKNGDVIYYEGAMVDPCAMQIGHPAGTRGVKTYAAPGAINIRTGQPNYYKSINMLYNRPIEAGYILYYSNLNKF